MPNSLFDAEVTRKPDGNMSVTIRTGGKTVVLKGDDPKAISHEVYAIANELGPMGAAVITDIIEAKAGLEDDSLFSWTEGVSKEETTFLSAGPDGTIFRAINSFPVQPR
jgi:hypothetical protein